MDSKWYAALVDAVVLAVSLIVAELVEADLADLIVKIVVAFQPVVLGYVLAQFSKEQDARIEHLARELRER